MADKQTPQTPLALAATMPAADQNSPNESVKTHSGGSPAAATAMTHTNVTVEGLAGKKRKFDKIPSALPDASTYKKRAPAAGAGGLPAATVKIPDTEQGEDANISVEIHAARITEATAKNGTLHLDISKNELVWKPTTGATKTMQLSVSEGSRIHFKKDTVVEGVCETPGTRIRLANCALTSRTEQGKDKSKRPPGTEKEGSKEVVEFFILLHGNRGHAKANRKVSKSFMDGLHAWGRVAGLKEDHVKEVLGELEDEKVAVQGRHWNMFGKRGKRQME